MATKAEKEALRLAAEKERAEAEVAKAAAVEADLKAVAAREEQEARAAEAALASAEKEDVVAQQKADHDAAVKNVQTGNPYDTKSGNAPWN